MITLANVDQFRCCILHWTPEKKLLYNPPFPVKSVAALPGEIWMFNCTTKQVSHSIQKCAKSFIFSKYLQGWHDLDHMSVSIHSQYYSTCSKYTPNASMLCIVHASCQWMCRWRIVQCWAKRLTDAVAISCADVMSFDINGTQNSEKTLKLKKIYQTEIPANL